VLAIVVVVLASAAGVAAQPTQLTDHVEQGCILFGTASDSTGALVAFESDCDLTGDNPDGNREIFQTDDQGGVVQLTDTAGCDNLHPAADADGSVVAFDSDCDLAADNVDGSVEIFTVSAGVFRQLTDSAACTSFAPSVNAAGTRVAFDSDCDFLGLNLTFNNEIFLVTPQGAILQLTSDETGSGCGSFDSSINGVGDRVAFTSDCDLAGTNPDEIMEVFRVTQAGVVTQMTVSPDDTCVNMRPASNSTGDRISFASDCDHTGQNVDGGLEIFQVATGGSVVQLSRSSSAVCDSVAPRSDASGDAVVYTSSCNPQGANGDGSFEIFGATPTGSDQLTSGNGCTSMAPSIAGAGDVVSYVSDCDPVATNGDGSEEIFQTSFSGCGHCGAPVSKKTPPTASDALYILQTSVGLLECPLCTCDVDSNLSVTATDALRVLRSAVGLPVTLDCD
jgi:Tol biopolymer transport system component